jgi:hypothetical protein
MMNKRSFFTGLGVGLVLAGVLGFLIRAPWHAGPPWGYQAPAAGSTVSEGAAQQGYMADGHFQGGTYGYGWRGHHHFGFFPFMLFCFFPLIPLFFFMMMRRRHWHRGWHHHMHHQGQPPIV